MIVTAGWPSAGFSEVGDGDVRNDPEARDRLSVGLRIPTDWATMRQVHGSTVHAVFTVGIQGEGDAMWTDRSGLPLAVFTADCYGIVLEGDGAVGVAHAGWKGAEAGVVAALRLEMEQAGHAPERALLTPGIGPCCFEVGPEVAVKFPEHVATTTWGAVSVDLARAIGEQVTGLAVDTVEGCTRHDQRFFSHRRDGTRSRQATVAWLR